MITYKRASSKEELKQILALQKQNIPEALSEQEKNTEGFVTVHHDLDILYRMNEACRHIIAKDKDQVVGYALCMDPIFREEIAVLQPMFAQIDRFVSPESTYLVMGQICIAKTHRKRGIFRALYATMKHETEKEYEAIITEVDAQNTRSLSAHLAVGFKELLTYTSGGQKWVILIL